ncbi:MAG: DUF177 domain-containing protein [Rikenellaceae bacterium]
MRGKPNVHGTYSIDFKGLSIGEHSYKMAVNNDLFATYEGCEISDAECICVVELNKSETMLQLQIEIVGRVEVECDRCLDPCWIEINFNSPLVVKFTNDEQLANEFDGEVMWITTDQLDLKHYIYESIIISLPYQRVHKDIANCNPEVASYLAGTEAQVGEGESEVLVGESEERGSEGSEEEELSALPEEQLEKLRALKAKMK